MKGSPYSYVRNKRILSEPGSTLGDVVRSRSCWIETSTMTYPTLIEKIDKLIADYRESLTPDMTEQLINALARRQEREAREIASIVRTLQCLHPNAVTPCPTCGETRPHVRNVTPRPPVLLDVGLSEPASE